MSTKISVTMTDVELVFLRKRARRIHGGNLSAAVVEAARLLRKQEALRAFLDEEGVPRLDAAELASIQEEWRRLAPPAGRAVKGRKRKSGAA